MAEQNYTMILSGDTYLKYVADPDKAYYPGTNHLPWDYLNSNRSGYIIVRDMYGHEHYIRQDQVIRIVDHHY